MEQRRVDVICPKAGWLPCCRCASATLGIEGAGKRAASFKSRRLAGPNLAPILGFHLSSTVSTWPAQANFQALLTFQRMYLVCGGSGDKPSRNSGDRYPPRTRKEAKKRNRCHSIRSVAWLCSQLLFPARLEVLVRRRDGWAALGQCVRVCLPSLATVLLPLGPSVNSSR
jgi:hypothetical protein